MIIRGYSQKELLDAFVIDLKINETDIFKSTTIVVPNLSIANWLSDQIALKAGIAGNISFVVLNQFINNCYSQQINLQRGVGENSTARLLKLSSIKYIIYDFLHDCDLSDDAFSQIRSYLVLDGNLVDSFRAFQLACQLELIFGDYLYLRTNDLIYDSKFQAKLPVYQQLIWQEILLQLSKSGDKTFLDIYSFFNSSKNLSLGYNLYIFGLTTIFPSQLQIIKQIANYCKVHWYQPVITYEYYHDLLDDRTREKLKRRVLKEPEISVTDLHLIDGNPLLANLALQSREFNEVIIANDIDIYELESSQEIPITLLNVVQDDIRKMNHRIDVGMRFSDGSGYYVDPIVLPENYDNTIKINICHNRMREVQVLFNAVCEILDKNPDIKLNDILVVAPDINEYDIYIQAVFSNEYTRYKDSLVKLPYHVCGLRNNHDLQLFNGILSILTLGYELKIKNIFDLLNQAKVMEGLDLNNQDVELLFIWFKENNIHFGLDENDYTLYGYDNFDIFTLKRLLHNLVSGACIPKELQGFGLDIDASPYDNLEYSQIGLCNKLIKFIDFLAHMRELFYESCYSYRLIDSNVVAEFFVVFGNSFILNEKDQLTIDGLISTFKSLSLKQEINLAIVIEIVKEYFKKADEMLFATGKLTFTSMNSAKNIPYKVIYVMGMNYGEFPRIHNKNKLSILYDSAVFADRNANIEDKQLFLDIIMSAQYLLYFSYVGRDESNNKVLNPSVTLNLFINVLINSIKNEGYVYQYIVKLHSLHPFSNNSDGIYSEFWRDLKTSSQFNNLHWNFNNQSHYSVQESKIEEISFANIVNTFYYSNTNLYNKLGIKDYKANSQLSDYEPIVAVGRDLHKQLYIELERSVELINCGDKNKIYEQLYNRGLLAYDHIGKYQFHQFYQDYIRYKQLQGNITVLVEFYSDKYNIKISDELLVNDNGYITVLSDFAYISEAKSKEIDYRLKIKGLLYLLMLAVGNVEIKVDSHLVVQLVKDRVLLRMGVGDDANSGSISLRNEVDSLELLDRVLGFYKKSLTAPTCIVEDLIIRFVKNPDKIPHNPHELKNLLSPVSYKKLEQDLIFYDNVNDYFDYTPLHDNTIIQIARMLHNVDIVTE